MFDPHARRRTSPVQRGLVAFYRFALLGALLVALAVAIASLTGLASELLHREWSASDGNLITKTVSVLMRSSVYLLVFILPMVLLAAGVALPVMAYVRFRDFATHPRNRQQLGRFALRRAWVLVLFEVPALLVLGALAMTQVSNDAARNPGIAPTIYLEPPGEEMPYWRH